MNYIEEHKKWMESSFIDEETKNELKNNFKHTLKIDD